MSRIDDIDALLYRTENLLPVITEKYQQSLSTKTITADLKIDIKDYFGNLRSILDYIAHDIVDKYCPTANPRNILYFPIRDNQASFTGVMNTSYPDLNATCPAVYSVLEDAQPYIRIENRWLTKFNQINNEHKHDRLVPQVTQETKRVNVQIQGGGSVNWSPGSVTFGAGVFIGGVPVNPQTQMPEPSSTQTVTIETWVDYHFEGTDISAIWLTNESLKQIKTIYQALRANL